VGTPGASAADAYAMIPADGEMRPNDRVLVIGAGGPMGQMHVIRAVASGIPGISVVAADHHGARLAALSGKVDPLAQANGVSYRAINTVEDPQPPGFTYYAIMAPVPAIAADAIEDAAPGAVINIFAGIPAPVRHPLNLDALIAKRLFVFGTSGSETEHMRIVLGKVTKGQLDTSASVDAVSGMAGAKDGLTAVENRTLAGKILVYPSLHDLPLIPLNKMPEKYPTVAAKMENGRWTPEAEAELLKVAA
jgi:threonine dehydrogenase-like Zn-dependent dehydrogenase